MVRLAYKTWHHFFLCSRWSVTVWLLFWEEWQLLTVIGVEDEEFEVFFNDSSSAVWDVEFNWVGDVGDGLSCDVDTAGTLITDCSLSTLLWLCVSPSSSTLKWNLSSSPSCFVLQKLEDGEMGIAEWYQSRLSSRVSRISWASGYTRSAHVSQSGCTM